MFLSLSVSGLRTFFENLFVTSTVLTTQTHNSPLRNAANPSPLKAGGGHVLEAPITGQFLRSNTNVM
jgi:hypothetical protein